MEQEFCDYCGDWTRHDTNNHPDKPDSWPNAVSYDTYISYGGGRR